MCRFRFRFGGFCREKVPEREQASKYKYIGVDDDVSKAVAWRSVR